MFISELLKRQGDSTKIAIKYGNNAITYSEWNDKSAYLSKIIKKNSNYTTLCIGVFLPNSIEYAIAYFGVMFLNKVLIPIGVHAKELEIISTTEYCEIDVFITDSQHKEYFLNNFKNYQNKITFIIIDTEEEIILNPEKSLISKTDSLNRLYTYDDVAIMLHTSGTTSNPKRVMLTHSNIIHNIESNIISLKLTRNDKVLIALPMFFGYCNTAQFLTHLYLGASIVILDSIFLPKQFFQIIENEKITNFTGVPSMLLMLLEYRYSENYDYSSLKLICFGGGKMPVEKLQQLINKYSSIGFVQTYGLTECSPRVTALLPKYSLSKIGSVGTSIPNVEIKIVNEDRKELLKNKIGEIIVQGKNIMRGYYKQPKITEETIKNGWLYTGDLGYIDDDGFLYLTGRKKNIIISGGINIYPEEIEQVLLQYPTVEDVCVVGTKHNLLGEVPIAKVILKSSTSLQYLKSFCIDKLADYKVPTKFEIVESLPKTYNGKIKRGLEELV